MNPFFSVVIPLYNKENFILDTLNSALNQDFEDFEIIVIDDGSTDDSLKKIESIEDSRLRIISQENKGVSEARNKGISRAEGKYIALLDADDYWYHNHLDTFKRNIDNFPEANVFYNNYEIQLLNNFIKIPKFSLSSYKKAQYIKDYFKASMIDPLGWTSACCFTKEIFNEVGKFDVNLRSGQDTDLMIRFGLYSVITFNPTITARYLIDSENNLAKSDYVMDRIKFLKKYKIQEQTNQSLKAYLDSNRFAIAMHCKMKGISIWKKLHKDIDPKNLNFKQNLLLRLPCSAIRLIKKTQVLLVKRGIYITAYD